MDPSGAQRKIYNRYAYLLLQYGLPDQPAQIKTPSTDLVNLTISPTDPALRGGTVVFDFPGAAKVCAELNRQKYFCDHRPGGGLRASPHFLATPKGDLNGSGDLFWAQLSVAGTLT